MVRIKPEYIISINYEDERLPSSVQLFKPVVFRDGHRICVVLGADTQNSIVGFGNSLEEAVRNWDNRLADIIDAHAGDSETIRFVLDIIKNV